MHIESIESEQKKILENLNRFSGFYLVGGTALALQMGHRISVDFDMFSSEKIPTNFLKKIEKVFKNSKVSLAIKTPDQLSVKVNGVKIDFVSYPFPPILGFISYKKINILRIREIAAMKAQTLGRRPALKYYIDLYFILKDEKINLNEIINVADKKFKDEFNGRLFLEQLLYLEDVPDTKINFLKSVVSKEQLQLFFKEKIKKIKI
ncbi:MAG: nucleotidyl transferase AbiEii/AbiGii toxin family protein [bacterium]|nr:nucleotidyl transferase AbiEii/AbiGii toxin family protein [bacterium]